MPSFSSSGVQNFQLPAPGNAVLVTLKFAASDNGNPFGFNNLGNQIPNNYTPQGVIIDTRNVTTAETVMLTIGGTTPFEITQAAGVYASYLVPAFDIAIITVSGLQSTDNMLVYCANFPLFPQQYGVPNVTINLASPGPIGNTTPNTGVFTDLKAETVEITTSITVPAAASGSQPIQLSQAEAMFDAIGAASTAQTNAENYAANAAGTAQTNAENYAANAAGTAQTNAENFATQAANTAQSNAENYAGSIGGTSSNKYWVNVDGNANEGDIGAYCQGVHPYYLYNSYPALGTYSIDCGNLVSYNRLSKLYSFANGAFTYSAVANDYAVLNMNGASGLAIGTPFGATPLLINPPAGYGHLLLTIAIGGNSLAYVDSGGSFHAPNFILTSDRKFKRNIKPIKKARSVINALKPKTFNKNGKPNSGFIAQDIMKIPELRHLVLKEKTGFHVDYIGLIAWIVKRLQEMDA